MAQTSAGALLVRATKLGMTVSAYCARVATGEKWCTGCKAWHLRTTFGPDPSRPDGLANTCRTGRKAYYHTGYHPHPITRKPAGAHRFKPPRDGDKRQARARINHLIQLGKIPAPNDLPCADCGHVWTPGERRHEYDHHLGYAAKDHEHVEPLCTTCHHKRERKI